MIVMFGWKKEAAEAGPQFPCYCYRCQRGRSWAHWKETEWVSFFTIKTIPFLSKHFVACTACQEPIELNTAHARQLAMAEPSPAIVGMLEERQLRGKSEVQRGFLQAQRQQHEANHARHNAANDRRST